MRHIVIGAALMAAYVFIIFTLLIRPRASQSDNFCDHINIAEGLQVFSVQARALNVRSSPKIMENNNIGEMQYGDIFETDSATLTKDNGYWWLQHGKGWSAICKHKKILAIPQNSKLMLPPENIPTISMALPINLDDIYWVQPYGNTGFAYTVGHIHGYDVYAQGLHAGLDLGIGYDVDVRAGINGVVLDTKWKESKGWYVSIYSGDYIIIYEHLSSLEVEVSDALTNDSILGQLNFSNNNTHMHMEVRYLGIWAINPLEVLAGNLAERLLNILHDEFLPAAYCCDGIYNQWRTPYDQPIIKIFGPIIGPKA